MWSNVCYSYIYLLCVLFQNGDGYISAKELGVLMRTLGRNPTEDEILNIMNEIDVDHNGKLDFSEFTVMMRDKLASEDMEMEIKQAFRWGGVAKKVRPFLRNSTPNAMH